MGKPFTFAYYSSAGHGITLFETAAAGARIATRDPSGYFRSFMPTKVSNCVFGWKMAYP